VADRMMTSSMSSHDLEDQDHDPISLRPIISKMARDRDSVATGHLLEMAYVVSNGHMADDVI